MVIIPMFPQVMRQPFAGLWHPYPAGGTAREPVPDTPVSDAHWAGGRGGAGAGSDAQAEHASGAQLGL